MHNLQISWNFLEMQQYCGCYSLLLRYMPKNVLFVTYSRSNSQPHTRLTNSRLVQVTTSLSFNSQPHTRLTCIPAINHLKPWTFNSQPHTRLTLRASFTSNIASVFQFTASYEADLQHASSRSSRGNLSIHSLIRG